MKWEEEKEEKLTSLNTRDLQSIWFAFEAGDANRFILLTSNLVDHEIDSPSAILINGLLTPMRKRIHLEKKHLILFFFLLVNSFAIIKCFSFAIKSNYVCSLSLSIFLKWSLWRKKKLLFKNLIWNLLLELSLYKYLKKKFNCEKELNFIICRFRLFSRTNCKMFRENTFRKVIEEMATTTKKLK